MQATAPRCDDSPTEAAPAVSWPQAQQEDAYWQRTFRQERYCRRELQYEDYAPAYCVGYIGCLQYGGDFADAESSLRANWQRIRGDSRLALHEALPAIRAAWDRMARLRCRRLDPAVNDATFEPEGVQAPATALERPAASAVAGAAAS